VPIYQLFEFADSLGFNVACLLCVQWFASFTDAGSKTEVLWLQLFNSHAWVSRNYMYKRRSIISFRH